ncbi:MAG: glycoside hydrolase family 92 protein [Candidatus Latescibacteria bacterium]|nr:glycoside hydrolase family 92 protein [Candidatus Latescibacterota bacterium]NIM21053.1 glycoside hydrolase family 92 protein [Candidatus Latescibacterota bacterium]NIM65188.1 glycoside hydrolase family 92 protein [Candidatus Latescibacterota bacterium]NIO01703.1 glycoside hydrolase family 92 protein [Candidatus Latescibacterota bacterium]NIO28220.1 glycoside hydrolase family 92 protein [Candidatus Latescibacterota bacterium]
MIAFAAAGACKQRIDSSHGAGSARTAKDVPAQSDYVDPFIGTGGHGHTYPGAAMPFGMVQLSPDTRLTGWDGCSGYHYSDSVVYGFTHTHLSGTGVSDYGDVLFMPTIGDVQLKKGDPQHPETGYCSRFRHEGEKASPGYYSVFLDDYEVQVELTVTMRAGFHRYTFPKTKKGNIIVDLEHRDPVIESFIRIVNRSEIEGFRRSKNWAKDQHVYFAAKFSKPFRDCGVAVGDEIRRGPEEAKGKSLRAYFTFATEEGEKILVKIGISAVDINGARKNLEAEVPGWDFDRIRNSASAEWNKALGKIEVEGGSWNQRTIFYTALYHTLLNPNLFMDVDGRYRGTDLQVHQTFDSDNYTVFSLWDTYRATHPLFTIIERGRTVDFIKTFIRQYEHGGLLPVWELAGNETWCMIGYHSVSVIADAYIKGIRDFDVGKAYEAMKRSADQDHLGLKHYKEKGYIPANREGDSVSKTLEYAYDDWCVAQMARELGRMEDYGRYIQRAQYYKNIFDPSTGFMRAKTNETWYTPFDPAEVNFNYTEANSWQYSFYVPQDVQGLIDLMGGKEAFTDKLDQLFSSGSETTGRHQPDITGLIGQYAHGNEPSHHMAYLYNFAGKPWKSQIRVREIMQKMYTDQPDGLCGNEDCGQMSAWYVFSALGFYPVTPGQDIYVIGSPLFEKATIHLENGKEFVIKASDASMSNAFIQSATLNGRAYTKSYLRHADIVNGGELEFQMGADPNWQWGAQDDDAPSTSISDYVILPVPYVASGNRVFVDSTEIVLASMTEGANIYYTLDGSEPTLESDPYVEPIEIKESAVLQAFADRADMPRSYMIAAEFLKIPSGRSIELKSPYSSMYAAGGDMALIDHIKGPDHFWKGGEWQGFQGVDLEAVVELERSQKINRISTGFLQDMGAWIFMPEWVEYAVSEDGERFEVIGIVKNEIPRDREGILVKVFGVDDVNKNARFARIHAKNIGVCPEWHRGAGGKAWLFADEIVIE